MKLLSRSDFDYSENFRKGEIAQKRIVVVPYTTFWALLRSHKTKITENTHFIRVSDKISEHIFYDSKKQEFKPSIFITFLGIWELLPTFRDEIPRSLFSWFGVKL